MNRRTTLALAAGLLGVLAPTSSWAQPTPTPAPPTEVFVHQVSPANSRGDQTLIDNRLANNNPSAIVLVTPSYNPNGVLSPNPIGVSFNASAGRWAIVDESRTFIPIGASFNVRVSAYPGTASQARRHRGSPANTVANFTDIDDIALNGKPNAQVIVTRSYGLFGDPAGVPHPHAVGVWYNFNTAKWSIFNEDGANMPVGITFNYIVPVDQPGPLAPFLHRALPANTTGIITYLDDPRARLPKALFLATHNWNPGGVSFGIYNDSPLGLFFDAAPAKVKWSIFNERRAPNIQFGTAFNVLPLRLTD